MNIHMHYQRTAAFAFLRTKRETLNVQRKERKKRMLEDIKLVPWIMSLIQSKGRLKLWWCTGPQFKWSHIQLKWTGFKPKACDEPQTTDHSWHTYTHTQMCGTGKKRLVFISADMRKAGNTETSHWSMGQESEALKVKGLLSSGKNSLVCKLVWNSINSLASVLFSGQKLKQPCSASVKMWEFLSSRVKEVLRVSLRMSIFFWEQPREAKFIT